MTALRGLSRFVRCERGATAIEYALIAIIMVVAIVFALPNVTPELVAIIESVVAGLNGTTGAPAS